MTDKEWQDRYQFTSIKGRIWTRAMIRKSAAQMLRTLATGRSSTERGAMLDVVLVDDSFLRPKTGMVPARVISDVAFEAFFRLGRQEAQS